VADAGWRAVRAVVAALACSAGAAGAEEVLPRPSVTVKWHDPADALPFAAEALAAELATLLDRAGVDLTWEAAGPDAVVAGSELRVVLLGAERAGPTDVMGSVNPASLSRTAWINLTGVERTLGLRRRDALSRHGEQRLCRGLSRVIAHELVHLLAPDLPHAREGLMAPRLGRTFLTAPQVSLSEPVAAALRLGAETPLGPRLALAER
jgi:hypothetical protein